MLSAVINWLFPTSCSVCRAKGSYLCENCLQNCQPPRALEEPWIVPLFSYKDKVVKSAIWEIKYHGRFVAAYAFGERLAEAAYSLVAPTLAEWAAREEYCNDILIVPIPPSKSGKKKRGYNQTAIIAKALFEHAGFPAEIEKHALEKIKDTAKQATLHARSVRLKNMHGAFSANQKIAHRLHDRIIILVDDVTTTGATLHDARRALLEAGAKEVFAVTIAH